MKDDFVFVDEFVFGIRWDAKYATWDNFTGKPVDGYVANRIVGTRALCAALERAREKAASLGFGLLLWDGYRPQRAVDCFVRWSKQPEDGRTKLRHYPNIDRSEVFEKGYVAAKSGHSRGSTVDLTLYHLATGELAPMGGDYDLMDPISHHGAKGITQVEARNRQYLCSIMEDCGFNSYDCEWWHYTLKHEPYPNTYFDFPITYRQHDLYEKGNVMQIRPARSADAEAINELLDQLGYPQDGQATTAARIQTWVDDPASAAYVADAQGDLHGVIAVHICPFFERDGTWGRIVALVVSDRARGRGVGSRLVAAAESFAASHGCLRMEVTSGDRRPDAHKFYQRCGYADQAGKSSRFLRNLPTSNDNQDQLLPES